MTRTGSSGRWVLAGGLLAVAIFVIDLSMPSVATWAMLYVAVVLLSWWLPGPRNTLLFAAACSGLILLGFFYAPAGGELGGAIANRLLAVLTVWVTAVFCLECKRVEKALRESQFFIDKITDATPALLYVYDFVGKHNVYANRACSEFFGCTLEEIQNKGIAFFEKSTHPDDIPKLAELEQRCAIAKEGEVLENEYRMKDTRGEYRYLHTWDVVFSRTSDGHPRQIVGTAVDVTKEKQTEAHARLAAIVESSNDAIISKTLDGNVSTWNSAAERIYGYSAHEMVGTNCAILIPPDRRNELPEILERIRQEERIHAETVHRRKDGKQISVSLTFSPIRDAAHRIVAASTIARDITERKHAEEKLLAYQDQLRSLVSQLSLAEERERRKMAADVHDAVGQALALIKIKLAALQESVYPAGSVTLWDELGQLAEQTIQQARSLAFQLSPPELYELGLEAAVEAVCERMQIEHGIRVNFADDGQPKLISDDVRVILFRAVRELLLNVTKHAQGQNVKISLNRHGEEIRVTVEDDGVGFDPSATSLHIQKGFGLFSIRERLGPLGGHISIDSKPGGGTRVTLVAPLNKLETDCQA